MQFSPKLKVAAEEIKAILKKHDIAAAIVLHTPGHAEFVLEIEPSYSCAKLIPNGVHFKAKREDYNDELKRNQVVSDTVNMLSLLSDVTAQNAMNLITVAEQLEKILDVEHIDRGFTSSTTQSN